MSSPYMNISLPVLDHAEEEALDATVDCYNKILALFPTSDEDRNPVDLLEVSMHIHALQHMIKANMAARSDPAKYRLFGYEWASHKEKML